MFQGQVRWCAARWVGTDCTTVYC